MPYIPIHRSERAYMINVEEKHKQEALKRLHERMAAGESPYDILEIPEKHKYYVDKIVSGLCPMTYALYGRIMNLDLEDMFDA